MPARLAAILLIITPLLCGCGGGGWSSGSGGSASNTGSVGRLELRQVLERAVPDQVTQQRFTGLSASQSPLYGPVTRDKAAVIVLENVPVGVTTLLIEYLLPSGEIAGLGTMEVVVQAGLTTVLTDPPFEGVNDVLQILGVTPQSATIGKDTTQQFTATGLFFDGSVLNLSSSVSWSSSNQLVAGVSEAGLVTGFSTGDTTITATYGSFQSTSQVTVIAPAVTSLLVSSPSPFIRKGSTEQLTATATFSDNSTLDVTNQAVWTSSDPAVAEVQTTRESEPGVVTALAVGSTTIGASFGGQMSRIELTVNPAAVASGFLTHRTLAAGKSYWLEVADLNSDDILDLVSGDADAGNVSVSLGRLGGTFEPALQLPVDHPSVDGVMADLNDDDIPDLVTADGFASISVLLGNGDGTFQPTDLLDAVFPDRVEVGDFNGDDVLDLATYNSFDELITLFLGDGDGMFPSSTNVTPGGYLICFTVAHLNNDRALDLIGLEYGTGALYVSLGNGDGTFQTPVLAATEPGPATTRVSLKAADLNGDDIVDLVAADLDADICSVFLGSGEGRFQTAVNYATGDEPNSLNIGDADGDGVPDLIVGYNSGEPSGSVLRGNGDGAFQAGEDFLTGPLASEVVAAEVTGDDIPDLVSSHRSDGDTVCILQGLGDGEFRERISVRVGRNPASVAAADVNGDDIPDLVTANYWDNNVSVLLGTGRGAFTTGDEIGGVGTDPRGVTAAFFNDDAFIDLVTVDAGSNRAFVLLGVGDGSFQSPLEYPTGTEPYSVVARDLNGDDICDLATANQQSGDISVLLGNGDGTFAAASGSPFAAGNGPRSIAVGDVNGDLVPDLITANKDSDNLSLLPGNGDGSFGSATRLTVGDAPHFVLAAYLNSDSSLDLISANSGSDNLTVLLGQGDGTFRTPFTLATGNNPRGVAVADLNQDNILDLVSVNTSSFDLLLFLGTEDGTYQLPALSLGVGSFPNWVTAVDLNDDDLPDLVSADTGANALAGYVSVLLATP